MKLPITTAAMKTAAMTMKMTLFLTFQFPNPRALIKPLPLD
ncbi:MAG: hypothetical protein AB1896_11740 [Thermodesulfobacteriota bacterium]